MGKRSGGVFWQSRHGTLPRFESYPVRYYFILFPPYAAAHSGQQRWFRVGKDEIMHLRLCRCVLLRLLPDRTH